MADVESTKAIAVEPEGQALDGTPVNPPDPAPHTIRILAPDATGPAPESESLTKEYAVVKKIGDGGMGVVYLANDRNLGRFVAIKRLNRSAMTRPALIQRFLREAKAIAALNHIHIVHVYALGEDQDGPYIVMEYVSGPPDPENKEIPTPPFTLADQVRKHGPLTLEQATDLGIKLGRAIEYAHACGVIHRDLKPSNVLLDESQEPKIVDFGLARRRGVEDGQITVPGEKMLSMGYGAPEQEADASQTDERADIYGLGAILYFAITGQNPRYFRENEVPEALRLPIVKALKMDREQRWANAKEFTAALMVIRSPSTVDVPTTKTSWRCKWCDTVNPVAVQYCGDCGWDGGDVCAECGEETRAGIRFCGECGADARDYEMATRLLSRLSQSMREKAYEPVVQQAGSITGFQPVGANGRKIISDIHELQNAAQKAIQRREQLKELIPQEMSAQNYERAAKHIEEYNTLSGDARFAADAARLPAITRDRDLRRAKRAIKDGEWEYAAQIGHQLMHGGWEDEECRRLSRAIRLHRWSTAARSALVSAAVILFLYTLSAAPIYRLVNHSSSRIYRTAYGPVRWLHSLPLLEKPLWKYADMWSAHGMYAPFHLPSPTLPAPEPAELNELENLRRAYELRLQRIHAEHLRTQATWPEEYAEALRELQQRMQQAGDFEGWTAVKSELIRFEKERTITRAVMEMAPEDLEALQVKYLRVLSDYSLKRSEAVIRLSEEQVKQLTALQKRLTMGGEMSLAQAVNNEIKRLNSSLEVTAAHAEIMAHAAAPSVSP